MRTLVVLLALGFASSVSAAEPTPFVKACLDSSNMPRAICECIEGLTPELPGEGKAFVQASYEKDKAAIAKLRAKMPVTDMIGASMFMVSAPQRCARDAPQPNR